MASITAGWQEREGEIDELQQHLDRPVVDLRLHSRVETIFEADRELFEATRKRQDRLQAIQQLYRYRLNFALEPARDLMRRGGDDPDLLDRERESAIEAVRLLDREHLLRVNEVHHEFAARWRPEKRPAVVQQRQEVAKILHESKAVAIAGGHVAVLANRMRLLGLPTLIATLPIFAWSAGAMALGERIVLFHDSPPQGAGNPEVLDAGLGLYRGLLPMPHARHRLQLHDPVRVCLLARRFSPETCVPLDEGMSVKKLGLGWEPGTGSLELSADGRVVPMGSGRL